VPDLDLIDKSELWVTGLRCVGVDLAELADAAAHALGLPGRSVFVTDVRSDRVVFDVLVPVVRLEDVAGREGVLLSALAAVVGVHLAADAGVHSRGVLGVLGAPPDEAEALVARAGELESRLRAYVARRVSVVSTGPEVRSGEIRDTNVEAVREALAAAGYEVTAGGVVDDNETAIAGRVARLLEDGFGVVITTGGVGAEDKDHTIEALELIVPDLATAVLATYEAGHGRHVKPDVRVAAGRLRDAVVVALPGPTREVRAALPALIAALDAGANSADLAEAVAAPIRALWHQNHHGHEGHHTPDGAV